MSENNFRSQLSSFRSSFGGRSSGPILDDSPPTFLGKLGRLNPFREGGYVQLPLAEREAQATATEVEEPSWFTLSRWDRLLIFGGCLIGSVLCFVLCFTLLVFRPRKFAIMWTLGSLLFVISFGVLQGPVAYVTHLVSPHRLPFTIAYFSSILLTLIFSLGLKSTILTMLASIVQILAALWYTVSYFPMGVESLKFASRIGARQATAWINS